MALILVVEDDVLHADMLSQRLKKRGYTTAWAPNGEEAIHMAQDMQPDLIVMDMRMPILDGFEATRKLKANKKTKKIPVLALTVYGSTANLKRTLSAGCDDYDTKPINFPRFIQKIETLLANDAGKGV